MTIKENQLKITSPCVITITWHMEDSMGVLIEELEQPVSYFYGGADLLPKLEEVLLDHQVGDQLDLYLEPEHAFGEYKPELVFFEERHVFPENTTLDMQFEGLPKGAKNQAPADTIYNVTEVYDKHIVVDGNHPLAGISIRLHIEVTNIREATPEELEKKSVSKSIFKLVDTPHPAPDQIH